jgi:hypothetical protein
MKAEDEGMMKKAIKVLKNVQILIPAVGLLRH